MPTIAVQDLLVHPRENDLVVGTYGRGLYITDITPLQELNDKVLGEDIHFFKVEPKVQRMTRSWGAYHLYGDRHLAIPNEPNNVVINYYLKNKAKEKAKITITDPYGKVFQTLRGSANAGINSVLWNMTRRMTREEIAQMRRSRDPFRRMVPPSEYVVILEVGDNKLTRKAHITKRTGWPIGPFTEDIK